MKWIGSFLFLTTCLFGLEAPSEITAAWEERMLGVRKEISDVADAVEELTVGITEPYFGEEFVRKLRGVLRKRNNGEFIEYWPNGKLKARLSYKNKEADGHIHGWYEDGTDAFKGYYKEGIKQGIHMVFHSPIKRRKVLDARVLCYNEFGQLDGNQTTTHPDDDLTVCIRYKNGVAEGPLEYWDGKGKQRLFAYYKNGKLTKDLPPVVEKKGKTTSKYVQHVNDVVRTFEKEVGEEFKLRPDRSGGLMSSDVESITVAFTVFKRGTIEEARELEVQLTEKLTAMINAHEGIRPYLREYPFPPARAHISLAFRKPDGSAFKDGSVTFVSAGRDDKIYYHGEDPLNSYKTTDLHEETYEIAVKKIKKP